MNYDELHQRLLETFALEMEEHLHTMAETLNKIGLQENSKDHAEHIHHLFRAVHSLKGAAQSVDLFEIEERCHQLENLLVVIRNDARPATQEEVQQLYEGLLWLQERSIQPKEGSTRGREPMNVQSHPTSAIEKTVSFSGKAKAEALTAPTPKAETGNSQNSVRLPVAHLDRLLSLLGEIQSVSHSGTQILQQIDEMQEQLLRMTPVMPVHSRAEKIGAEDISVSSYTTSATMPTFLRKPHESHHPNQYKHVIHALRKRTSRFLFDLELSVKALDKQIQIARLQPFLVACEPVRTYVKAKRSDDKKPVRFKLVGEEVQLDRKLIQGLRSVLMHLAINALDHGIEPAKERARLGKPESGELLIKAERTEEHTIITVQDDGQGVDEAKLVEKLKKRGAEIPQDRETLLSCLFEPGMSTATETSRSSGRGVGLDAVRKCVLSMRGSMSINSTAQEGVIFKIQLPRTLSAYQVLLIMVGQTRYAIDASQVKLTRRLRKNDVIESDSGVFLTIEQAHYPLLNLASILGSSPDEATYGLLLTDGIVEKALLVDQIVGLESVVVKNLEDNIGKVEGVSGGVIQSDGSVSVLLDVEFLLKEHRSRMHTLPEQPSVEDDPSNLRILVVEDAMTTRMLEVNVLESAGYQVVAAVDGQQAWELLRQVAVDLVVSDVDMPRLDGFELTRRIRESAKWSHIPVILLTARESREDRLKGMNAGANLYMKKSHFDQSELLEAVKRQIPL